MYFTINLVPLNCAAFQHFGILPVCVIEHVDNDNIQ